MFEHPSTGNGTEGGARGREAEDQKPGLQRPLPPVSVAESSGGEQQAGENQGIRIDDPLQLGRGRVQLLHQSGQGDVEHGVGYHHQDEAQTQNGQSPPAPVMDRLVDLWLIPSEWGWINRCPHADGTSWADLLPPGWASNPDLSSLFDFTWYPTIHSQIIFPADTHWAFGHRGQALNFCCGARLPPRCNCSLPSRRTRVSCCRSERADIISDWVGKSSLRTSARSVRPRWVISIKSIRRSSGWGVLFTNSCFSSVPSSPVTVPRVTSRRSLSRVERADGPRPR